VHKEYNEAQKGKPMEQVELEVTIKGQDMIFDVYGELDSGGSTRWGSDEPPWFDVEIDDIRWCGRKISNRLWNEIMKHHEDTIVELFENEYL
jgi:hypothetical protein